MEESDHMVGASISESIADKDDAMVFDKNATTSSVGPKRQIAPRSKVWLEFEKSINVDGESVAYCIHCREPLRYTSSNGTSSCCNHLKTCKVKKAKELGEVATMSKDVTPSFKTSKFNRERSRRYLAMMIVKHEYPYNMVGHAYFRSFVNNLQPSFDLKHRTTVTTDVIKLYKEERRELYNVLGKHPSRISLTTDLWTAKISRDSYLCLTAHYIDDDWVLNNKILNFRKMVGGHTGEDLHKVVMKCLVDWNIEGKVSSITLDNATANDSMISKLKIWLNREKRLVLGGSFFHIRCTAHIINLIVKDGERSLGSTLGSIRESCQYVRQGSQRKLRWNAIVDELSISTDKVIRVDCKSRWNSTYDMLATDLHYQEAFHSLEKVDRDFNITMSNEEWEFARVICDCLKVFYDSTKTLSGTRYPTADSYFSIVCEMHISIKEWLRSENVGVRIMATHMMTKFKKYWSDCCLPLAVSFVLNPGYKLKFVHKYFIDIYGDEQSLVHTKRVQKALGDIYGEYAPSQVCTSSSRLSSSASSSSDQVGGLLANRNKRLANWYHLEGIGSSESKSELENYLEEPLFPLNETCLLEWWKVNSPKYPTLSRIARDILCIPASSVPSESTFSTSGRVLNEQRASLGSKNVEALLCTQSWLPSVPQGSSKASSTNEVVDIADEGSNCSVSDDSV